MDKREINDSALSNNIVRRILRIVRSIQKKVSIEGVQMDLVKLLQDLATTIASLQTQLADAQVALDGANKVSYDKGFADGVASVVVPPASDKIYSQVELDAAVTGATSGLQAQVSDLQAQVNGFQATIDQKVADAVAALKVDLLAKILDFENLLK